VNISELIAFQRAEFDAAERWRLLMAGCEILLLFLAIVSVFVSPIEQVVIIALISFVIGAAWAWFHCKYRDSRDVAERARRATLVMEGYDKEVSAAELTDIKGRFTASMAEAAKKIDKHYYKSDAEPGSARLAELLEESSFFSMHLQRVSSRWSWYFFVIALLGSLVSLVVAAVILEKNAILNSFRIFLLITSFLVTGRAFRLAMQYTSSARALERIHARLAEARARGYPRPDLFLLLSDYNAVTEAASLHLPFAYDLNKDRLNKDWADFRNNQPKSAAKPPRIRGL